ncbi:MAG TPA: hypothetical protein VF503_32235 [Sphingobium sp.]|uniref:hypothetical protein n=1 Tax=Sphingobium sp. TaxID=1912891 RepID=UPI002ED5018B
MIQWLADNVSVFKMQHNAHREFNMSVEQHLLHRDRIGNRPSFVNAMDRDACIARDQLWELRVIMLDGLTMDIAGSSLNNCVHVCRQAVTRNATPHLAA